MLLLPLLLLALLLPGCRFFTASFFPGFLAQAEKSYDLGSEIDDFLGSLGSADYRWYARLFVLTSAADVDYGAVLIEIDSLPDKLLLMADPSGSVQYYDSASTGWGLLHLLDATSPERMFVVGQFQFPPGGLSSAAINSSIPGDRQGFSDGANNYMFWTDGMYSNQLQMQTYTSAWGGGSSAAPNIDDYQYGFELRGVYYDPLAAGKEVALVFFNYESNQVFVFRVPMPSLIVGPMTSNYPPVVFQDVDAGNVSYTRKGIVMGDGDGRAQLMDFNGNETGKGLDLGQRGDARIAFDIAGEHFYVFDPEDQMLYRGNTGW